jgi:hypothetical protein
MFKFALATLLALGCLLSAPPVSAQSNTRDQIRMIEQEYARQSNGQLIPDNQLEYYLDRANSGWSMNQISQDMASSRRQYANSQWRPQSGWVAREVVCTSDGSKYRECPAPFRGRAVITQQISKSACIEGQTWGQKSDVIWVNRGCRARFGMVAGGNSGNERMIVCQSNQGAYRSCDTGINGRVVLVNRLNNSAACDEGRSWGQSPGKVWVNHGCRAQFSSENRHNGGGNLDRNYAATCSSTGGAQVRCNWDSRYGQPRLQQQLSQSSCTEGRTWGYDDRNGLWVSNGCRATFVANQYNHGNNNGGDYNNGGNYNNYEVTCSSSSNELTRCNWDSRQGQPRMVQQLSQSSCTQGRDWGYDDRNGLWVDNGCRARFANH